MKIGALKAATFDDVTFWLKPTWGGRNRYQASMVQFAKDNETEASEEDANMMFRFDDLRKTVILETVVRVDGITGEDDKPVAWADVALEDLPPEMVEDLFREVVMALGLRDPDKAPDKAKAAAEAEAGDVAGNPPPG